MVVLGEGFESNSTRQRRDSLAKLLQVGVRDAN